ncbi:hypothetical protein ABXT60_03550 [Candidatus Njordibacter sp. Uisw_056]
MLLLKDSYFTYIAHIRAEAIREIPRSSTANIELALNETTAITSGA